MNGRPSSHVDIHRALSSPVRNRILTELRSAAEPQDVQEIATLLGLHANTVRAHLAILEQAGLVASRAQTRRGPGRPRLVYSATPADDEGGDREHGYRFLAEVLASYVQGTAVDPAAAGEEAGAAWGRHLVEEPGPFRSLPGDAAAARIVAMLAEMGFEPELDPGNGEPVVLLRRCPFLDVAKEHRDVVCSMHLGLMRGAAEKLGGRVEVRDLLPFVRPDLCLSHLEVAS